MRKVIVLYAVLGVCGLRAAEEPIETIPESILEELLQATDDLTASVSQLDTVLSDTVVGASSDILVINARAIAQALIFEQDVCDKLVPAFLDVLATASACKPISLSSTPTIILEPGVYCVANDLDNTITVSASNVVIDFDGRDISVVGQDTPAIVLPGNQENITLKNGRIVMRGSTGIKADELLAKRNVLLQDLTFVSLKDDLGNQGVLLTAGLNVQVERCLFQGSNMFDDAFVFDVCADLTVEKTRVETNELEATRFSDFIFAFAATNSIRCLFKDCSVIGFGTGFLCESIVGGVVFENCFLELCNIGYSIDTVDGLTMRHCTAQQIFDTAFLCIDVTRGTLRDCLSSNHIDTGGYRVIDSALTFVNCTATDVADGIRATGTGPVSAQGCRMEGNFLAGFDIAAVGSFANNIAQGNVGIPPGIPGTTPDPNYQVSGVRTTVGAAPYFQVSGFAGAGHWDNISLP